MAVVLLPEPEHMSQFKDHKDLWDLKDRVGNKVQEANRDLWDRVELKEILAVPVQLDQEVLQVLWVPEVHRESVGMSDLKVIQAKSVCRVFRVIPDL